MTQILRISGPELSARPRIEFAVTINGFEFGMAVQWLSRVEMWLFQMFGPSGERVIDGLRLVANTPLLMPYSDARLPPAHLVLHDTTNTFQDPGRDDLRTRHILLHIEPVEPVENFRISVSEAPKIDPPPSYY